MSIQRDVQLQRPSPGLASALSNELVTREAMEEIVMTRPGSKFVASLASSGVNLCIGLSLQLYGDLSSHNLRDCD